MTWGENEAFPKEGACASSGGAPYDPTRPRFRYTIGPDSFLMPFGKRFFTDGLVLRFIRDHFKV